VIERTNKKYNHQTKESDKKEQIRRIGAKHRKMIERTKKK
jgi:hypothetical protein